MKEVNRLLSAWGHYLGPCNRPFGAQGFVLELEGKPVGVAVSASTVSATCGGFERREVVELARLCSHPSYPEVTRVTLRLWRLVAVTTWRQWCAKALVAYSDSARHGGQIYRFDGWERRGTRPRSGGGGTWTKRTTEGGPKTLWVWECKPFKERIEHE